MPASDPSVLYVVWQALKDVIVDTWPEVNGKIFQDTLIERKDWTNLLNDGEIGVPWCVVKLTYANSVFGGAIPKLDMVAEITYIDGIEDAGIKSEQHGQQMNASAYLVEKLMKLKTAMFTTQECGTILDEVPINTNADNPANDVFIEQGWDYQAASITITTTVVIA